MGGALWRDIALISAGAVAGANLRFAVSRLSLKYLSPSVPYGTLIVNVTGSFVLGFFLAWTTERVLADPHWRPLVAVGFCGAYTTYSSYGFETISLLEQGHYGLAAANFLANNVQMLYERGLAGGTVLRAVAGFTGEGGVETTSLVDVGGKLPLVVEFIDSADKVERVMPELKQMVGARLIVRERVQAL